MDCLCPIFEFMLSDELMPSQPVPYPMEYATHRYAILQFRYVAYSNDIPLDPNQAEILEERSMFLMEETGIGNKPIEA